jgi:hypothetical protein
VNGHQSGNQWGGQQPGKWSTQQPPNQYGGQWGTHPNRYRPQQPAWGAQQLGQYGSQAINQYDKQFAGDPRDTQLRQLVDTLFAKYDRDCSLTLTGVNWLQSSMRHWLLLIWGSYFRKTRL